jgi:hypothetical protein
MRRLLGALRWLFLIYIVCALSVKLAHATPTVTAECFAVQQDATTEAGTERTWFIFRAVVTLGGDPPPTGNFILAGNPVLKLGVLNTADPVTSPVSVGTVTMQRDTSRGSFNGRESFWIALVRGSQINGLINSGGVGRARSFPWAVVAGDTDLGQNPPATNFAASPLLNVAVYPSYFDVDANQYAVVITPVDANGNNDKAPGPGQNGNGLRVDPQDTTRPNDGGGGHVFTWRVRLRTLSGMPPAVFRRESTYDAWNFPTSGRQALMETGVLLFLLDPQGGTHICPMQGEGIDPATTYPTISGNFGRIQRPVSNTAFQSGVIYHYTMQPDEYTQTAFGGDLQGNNPTFTQPDGLPAIPLGGSIGDPIGRPYANVYAAFANLDSLLLFAPFPPPPMPFYTQTAGRAGQWRYYYQSAVDFRSDGMTQMPWNAGNRNFVVNGWSDAGNQPVSVYTDFDSSNRYGSYPNLYQVLTDSDDYSNGGYPGSPGVPYNHPYVTPIISDGHWTDDLLENRNLQLPPGQGNNYTGELTPNYDDPNTTVASNSRRSRVTTKTKVRFQCRVTHVPKGGFSGPLTVRVWIGTSADGTMQAHVMQVAPNQGAINYANGVVYYYDAVFPPGQEGFKAIYYDADDGVNRCIWPRRPGDDAQGANLPNRTDQVFFGSVTQVGKNYLMEPRVNTRPTIANGRVTPASGPVGTTFTYEVLYRDADNDSPLDAWVIIDNDPVNRRYRMTEAPEDAGNSYAQGRRYRFSINTLPGSPTNTHTFYFQFRDNWAAQAPIRREFGEWVTFPQGDDNGNPTTIIDGPTIVANNPPELREVSIAASDTAFNTATKYDFFVRYRDADNNPPSSIKLYVELYDKATNARLTTDPGKTLIPAESGTNYASGVQFHLPAPIRFAAAPAGQEYRYRFITSDGIDVTSLVTVGTGSQSLLLNTAVTLRPLGGNVFDDIAGTRNWEINDNTLFVWQIKSDGTTNVLSRALGQFTVDAPSGRITVPGAAPTDTIKASYRYEQTVGPVVNPNNPPTLSYPDVTITDVKTNYQTVSQTVGDTTTNFQFAIVYKDADNQKPLETDDVTEGLYLVIDNTTRIALTRDPATPLPVDYRAGVKYIGSTTLPIGDHQYHFEATDGAGAARRPLLGGENDNNTPPNAIPPELKVSVISTGALSNLTIVPFPKGKHNQLYQFTVTYTNQDDRAPASPIELWVGSTATPVTYTFQAMNLIDPISPGAYRNGVRYQLELTAPALPLDPGTHPIAAGFQADRTRNAVPFQDLIVNGVPVLSRVGGTTDVSPDPVSRTQDVTFTVKYTDLNGDPPAKDANGNWLLLCNVKPQGAAGFAPLPVTTNPATWDRTKQFLLQPDPASLTAAQYQAGVAFTWTGAVPVLPNLPADTGANIPVTYYFTAKDGDAANNFSVASWSEDADPFPPPPGYNQFTVTPAGTLTLLLPNPGDPATNYGTLTPLTGSKTANYTFKVIYKHTDGIGPTATHPLELLIDQSGAAPKTVIMTASTPPNPTPADFKAGVTYTYVTAPGYFDYGKHTYRFFASDAVNTFTLRNGANDFDGPTINNPPVLSAGTVIKQSDPGTVPTLTPAFDLNPHITGTTKDTFVFRVTYADEDNAPPAPSGYVRVVVNNPDGTTTTLPMKLVTLTPNWKNGVTYETQPPVSLSAGDKTFHFEANDGIDAGRFPSAAEITGLSVKNLVQLSPPNPGGPDNEGTLTPLTGTLSTPFTFSIKYKHLDGTFPTSIQVNVTNTKTGTAKAFNMTPTTPPNPTSADIKNGVVYSYTTVANDLLAGTNTYYFTATDGLSSDRWKAAAPDYNGPTINFPPALSNPTAFVEGATVIPTVDANNALNPPVLGNTVKKIIFRVTYQDQDGVAPPNTADGYVRVIVSGEQPIDLAPKAGDPGDYKAGVVYESAPTLLKAGQKTFHFEAKDGLDTARIPAAAEITGLTIANVTQLKPINATGDDGTLSPRVGPLSTTFTYQIIYQNADNTAPAFVNVVIDDGTQNKVVGAMTKVGSASNYAAGVTYQYQYRFPSGASHTYRFEAQDTVSADYTAKYPLDGSNAAGPTINIASFDTPIFVPNPGTVGSEMTMTSKLTPAQAVGITLQLVKPDGSGVNNTVNTNTDGTFSFKFTPDQTGDWKVRLSWGGRTGEYDPVTTEFPFRVTGYTLAAPSGVLDMIATPLIPATADPTISLGPTKSDGSPVTDIRELNLVKWLPNNGPDGHYSFLTQRQTDADFPGILAGNGYWLKPAEAVVLNPRGKLADQGQPYSIPLAAGWNMIGSVYLQNINWSAVKVQFNGQTMNLQDAGQIVRPTAWGYNPNTGSYELVDINGVLKTGRGYWVRALQPCQIILSPPGTRAASPGRDVVDKASSLRIVARVGNRMDTDNYAPLKAPDKSRLALMEKPPYVSDYVTVRFLSSDSITLPADTRAAANGQNVVAFEVATDHANADVSVQFPNASTLGRRSEITLVDLASGNRRAIGTASAFTFNTGDNQKPRRFALLINAVRLGDVLRITDLQSSGRASGSLSFSYNVTVTASVRAQIAGASGQTIRMLTQGTAVTRGVNSLLWDGKDNRGVAVPAGTYILKITATDDRGRVVTAVLPVTLVR